MSDATNVWDEVPGCVLMVSTNADPDVAEYPSSGKVAAVVDGRHRFFRAADAIEHAGAE